MPWYAWVVVGFYVIVPIITISKIGQLKTERYWTPGDAIASLVIAAAVIGTILSLAT